MRVEAHLVGSSHEYRADERIKRIFLVEAVSRHDHIVQRLIRRYLPVQEHVLCARTDARTRNGGTLSSVCLCAFDLRHISLQAKGRRTDRSEPVQSLGPDGTAPELAPVRPNVGSQQSDDLLRHTDKRKITLTSSAPRRGEGWLALHG